MKHLFTALILIVASCTGPMGPEGPQGPAGEQGATGTPGADGTDGETIGKTTVWIESFANTDYSDGSWITSPIGFYASNNDVVMLYTGIRIGDDYIWSIRTDFMYGRAAVLLRDVDKGLKNGYWKLVLIEYE